MKHPFRLQLLKCVDRAYFALNLFASQRIQFILISTKRGSSASYWGRMFPLSVSIIMKPQGWSQMCFIANCLSARLSEKYLFVSLYSPLHWFLPRAFLCWQFTGFYLICFVVPHCFSSVLPLSLDNFIDSLCGSTNLQEVWSFDNRNMQALCSPSAIKMSIWEVRLNQY